ncbi:adhesion G-protein coupled receptor D2 [Amia ocellicauda]|uniref:adhesion G-protein coupled receptor D2 n=1 Tax=Amia ocellicauda TaxID=2972642 RepID=UPI003464AD52
MRWFKLIYPNLIIYIYNTNAVKLIKLPTLCTVLYGYITQSCLLPHFPKGHKFTYKYGPGCRPWREAEQECEQSSGPLATVTTAQENRELTSFLQALNITEQVWIESPVMDHKLRAADSLILEFSGWDYWLELRCSIVLKVFSYTPAWTVWEPVKLTLHTAEMPHNPDLVAFSNDGLWHSSWARDGKLVLVANGSVIGQWGNHSRSDSTGGDFFLVIGDYVYKSFSWNIMQLNVWDRVLNITEIQSMEEDCSLNSSGLIFQWNLFSLPFSKSLKTHWGIKPCQDSSLPRTAFFNTVSRDPLTKYAMKDFQLNTLKYQDLSTVNSLIEVLQNASKEKSVDLRPDDLLYLTRFLENVSHESFTVDKFTGTLSDILSVEGKNFTLSTKNIDLRIESLKLSHLSGSFVFKPETPSNSSDDQDQIQITDTELSRLRALGYNNVTLILVYYHQLRDLHANMYGRLEKGHNSSHIGRLATAVISVTGRVPSKCQNIPVAVHYTLSSNEMNYKPVCMFWNFSLIGIQGDGWSSEGCRATHTGSIVTYCFCNHTTNFAVLMKVADTEWLVTSVTPHIPKSDRTTVHKNLFVALTAAHIVLLCSELATYNKMACEAVTALLYLFFLAAFTWMLVEGLLLWSKVVIVNLCEVKRMKYYYLIGWGKNSISLPRNLASARGEYMDKDHCWLSVENGVIWGFAGPVICIIMVNVVVLARVLGITSGMRPGSSSRIEQVSAQTRTVVKPVLVLLPILGLTWLCGVLVSSSTAMAYIFVLLNSLQVSGSLFLYLECLYKRSL